jgi:hypothetical protein
MSADVLIDRNRDLYVPIGLLVAGFAIYVGFYVWKYEPSGAGIAAVCAGVAMMTVFKAGLMVGFALVAAGPLGVSFGGPLTATLKLAAVAVFCDGCTTWVDAGVEKLAGFGGGMMAGMISFPVALAIYWILLTYLFSMDSGDSWMVVILLAIFDAVVRWVLVWVLLAAVLNWGGVAVPAGALGGGGAASSSGAMKVQIQELKDRNLLIEAREYIGGGRQESLLQYVDAWYAAGCKNVWFEGSRDINARFYPGGLIVELPAEKDKRATCYDILRKYYTDMQMGGGAGEKDEGDPYMFVGMR